MIGARAGGIMASSARLLMERARGFNNTGNGTNPFSQITTNRSGSNATFNLISNLVFAESKSVRTSTIILAAFNVLAAFATASSILYDCYWASKRCNPKFKASKFCVSSIHPAETFPLIVSIGILIQGLVFAAVQGQGLKSLFTTGCDTIAQFMWPALFIVPYLQLVFGMETAIRSFRSTPFQARGKYDVTICLLVVLIMLIVTWIPSNIWQEPNSCFASLMWFITRYGKIGFVLLSTVGGLMIITALTIFTRLSSVNLIDEHQRITASRMVYYLVLGIVSLAFVIPYFFSLIDREGDIKLAMMATVVVNLSGLMTGLLQLFLRSNTASTSFGGKGGRSIDRGASKQVIRIFGPNELAMQAQLTNPVTGPRTPASLHELDSRQGRTDSRASLISLEKGRIISMGSLPSPGYRSTKEYEVMPPTPLFSKPTDRKQAYSLFPGSSPEKPGQPMSFYDISGLEPPPQVFGNSRHRRDSSVGSSATVQIGLRISHAPTPSQEDLDTLPVPSSTYKSHIPSLLPLAPTTYNASAIPKSKFASPSTPSSPLRVQTDLTTPVLPIRSPRRPQPVPITTSTTEPSQQSPSRSPAVMNKTLPPTPKAFLPLPAASPPARVSTTQLSPAVYSPDKKLPAKIKTALPAAGFVGGPMSANPLKGNPVSPPVKLPARSGSERGAGSSQQATTKADWI